MLLNPQGGIYVCSEIQRCMVTPRVETSARGNRKEKEKASRDRFLDIIYLWRGGSLEGPLLVGFLFTALIVYPIDSPWPVVFGRSALTTDQREALLLVICSEAQSKDMLSWLHEL